MNPTPVASTKKFVSRANGLELHIPADMGGGVQFFSKGEDARSLIDDGEQHTRVDDPDQLRAELERAQAKLKALEAKQAEQAAVKAPTKAAAKTPAKAAKPQAVAPAADEKEEELA